MLCTSCQHNFLISFYYDIVMEKVKLIFFDMEGTIFKSLVVNKHGYGNTSPGLWHLIAEHLGDKALEEENETKQKWNSGGYSGYVEWMEDTIMIHKKYGLKKEFFDNVMNLFEYHEGVREVFNELKRKGYKTVLVSGGFKAQADKAQTDLKIDHAFTACEYFWDNDGNLAHWNLLPCDYAGKLDFMELLMKEYGLTSQECAFVGDGKNDVFLAKEVGLSIAFNGAEELQEVCTHSINQPEGKEDFREILKYLDFK
jgi:phosphoserine phosphatase